MKYNVETLLQMAKTSQEKAYAPYSNFAVGVALFAEDGHYYGGCNVENASYPCSQCAEAGAIANMLLGGAKKIEAVLVLSDTEKGVWPCGQCLQKLSEFTTAETEVLIANPSGIQQSKKFSELFHTQFDLLVHELKQK